MYCVRKTSPNRDTPSLGTIGWLHGSFYDVAERIMYVPVLESSDYSVIRSFVRSFDRWIDGQIDKESIKLVLTALACFSAREFLSHDLVIHIPIMGTFEITTPSSPSLLSSPLLSPTTSSHLPLHPQRS